MRFILFILLVFSLSANAQVGNKNFFLTETTTAPRPPGFDWDALTPQSPTSYNNAGTVVIDAKSFTNLNTGVLGGDNIQISGTGNITIKNSYIGPSRRNGITIENFTGTIRFENCLFVSNKCAIEVSTSTCTFQMENSQCINPFGAPECKGQFFQAVSATMTNSYIRDCAMENFLGLGSTEDWISFFNSGGTSGSRFIVENNVVRGGGPSISGGGFMLGDHGGSYITVQNNKFLNPGNYQIAVSGGNNFIVQNNLAYSQNTGYTRIGMYAYGQEGAACNNITFQSNAISQWNNNTWYAGDGSPAEDCGIITGANPTFTQTNLTNLTLAQLAMATDIIDLVDPDRVYHLMEEGVQFRGITGSCISSDVPVLSSVPIPTPNAGADAAVGGTTTTLDASGSTSTDGLNYQWVQVSGPTNSIIASPNSAITNVSGLSVSGVYEYRCVVSGNNGAKRADWTLRTKS